ncbi:cytochrome P450 [Nocardioides campestrisoli]|uniref:cytochrome P450 n=1 Tax=Nocardioides campestrisoli TaxID=2736757 RepID=UPI002812134B|nr:cytochrome P450 [Nocardioides campestrisoli]
MSSTAAKPSPARSGPVQAVSALTRRIPAGLRPTRAIHWGVSEGLPRFALRTSARRGDLQGRLVVATNQPDPAPAWQVIEDIRARGPLPRTAFGRVTARHAVVREVLSSPAFAAGVPGPAQPWLVRLRDWAAPDTLHPMHPPSLLVTEPPDHVRYRKLVTRVFTARAVERLRDRTEEIAAGLLDDLAARAGDGPVDLVQTYCAPLPVAVICEVLGVPADQHRKVLEMGTAAAASLDMGLPWSEYRQVDTALAAFDTWLTDHLRLLRSRPGDDLMSQLVRAQDDGVGLSEQELKATAGLVLAAGFETTVNLLGNGVVLLRENPEQLAVLREDPSWWGNAVEEALRVDPPVLLTARTCREETTVAGVSVSPGMLVATVLGGANRDPEVFADPTRFDVKRANAREHLSFSAGRHHCLGASLARMEGEVGLRALFDRFPDLQLAPGAVRRPTRILRGYHRLPVVLA